MGGVGVSADVGSEGRMAYIGGALTTVDPEPDAPPVGVSAEAGATAEGAGCPFASFADSLDTSLTEAGAAADVGVALMAFTAATGADDGAAIFAVGMAGRGVLRGTSVIGTTGTVLVVVLTTPMPVGSVGAVAGVRAPR